MGREGDGQDSNRGEARTERGGREGHCGEKRKDRPEEVERNTMERKGGTESGMRRGPGLFSPSSDV